MTRRKGAALRAQAGSQGHASLLHPFLGTGDPFLTSRVQDFSQPQVSTLPVLDQLLSSQLQDPDLKVRPPYSPSRHLPWV